MRHWVVDWDKSLKKVLSGNTFATDENQIVPAEKYKAILRYDSESKRIQLQTWEHTINLNHKTNHYYKAKKWGCRIIFNLNNNTTLVRYKTAANKYATRYISLKNYSYIMSRLRVCGAIDLIPELLDYYAGGPVFSNILKLNFHEAIPVSNTILKNSKDMKTALKKINGNKLDIPKRLLSLCNQDLAFMIIAIVKPDEINKVTQYMVQQENTIKNFVDQASKVISPKEMHMYKILQGSVLLDQKKGVYRDVPGIKREACDELIYNGAKKGIHNNSEFFYRLYSYLIPESVPRHICNDYVRMSFELGEKINLKIKSVKRLQQEHDELSSKYSIKKIGEIEPKPWYRELKSNDKYSIHLIDVAEDLAEEGVRMKHCVSSYSRQINRGESAIFHIELKDQDHLAEICGEETSKHKHGWTLEAGVSEDSENAGQYVLYNKQFRGFANCSPPKEVISDINQLLKDTRIKIFKKDIKKIQILTNEMAVRPVEEVLFDDIQHEVLPF